MSGWKSWNWTNWPKARASSTLFEAKDAEVFPAQRAREQFEKFFVPGFGVLLLLLEAGGAWLLWRWISQATGGIAPDRAMPALSLVRHFCAAVVSVRAVFRDDCAAGKSPVAAPRRSFVLLGAYICFVTALGIAGVKAEFPKADF